MIDKKLEIGLKIKEFGEKNFSSQAEFSRKLGMKNPQHLTPYINGRSFPGFELLAGLQILGMDINLLLSSGETQGAIVKEPNGAPYMNYKQMLEENERLVKQNTKLKAEVYDLKEENEELKKHIAQMQDDYDDLAKEITKLKVSKEDPEKIFRMEKSKTS